MPGIPLLNKQWMIIKKKHWKQVIKEKLQNYIIILSMPTLW